MQNSILSKIKKLELCQPLKKEEIFLVEKDLNIKLAQDFIDINLVCSYEFIGCFDYLNFGLSGERSVIGETLYYRKNHNLPDCYLVLFADDVSFVLLKSKSTAESEVIWCDYQDFFNICDGRPMEYNPTIFLTFTDFYEFLLDEEEKSRASDNSN